MYYKPLVLSAMCFIAVMMFVSSSGIQIIGGNQTGVINLGQFTSIISGNGSSGGGNQTCSGNFACLDENEVVTGAWTFANNITMSQGATIDNDEKIFNGYNNLQQVNVNGLAWHYIVVDSENRKDDYYTHNTGSSGDRSNVTVSRSGRYTVDYNTCFDMAADLATPTILITRVIINGAKVQPGSLGYEIGDPGVGAVNCVSVISELNVSSGDKVALQAILEDGGLGVTTTQLANATSLYIRWTGI